MEKLDDTNPSRMFLSPKVDEPIQAQLKGDPNPIEDIEATQHINYTIFIYSNISKTNKSK